ncbi:MAG: DEAD/DEAH box helicase, partial [Planctomycetes bacterium]|nr:DEAD/DEAH box helicase [Planctomycetota bacterium]
SPFGAAVHAPWAMAAAARLEEGTDLHVETMGSDDGIVFRIPETGEPPDLSRIVPSPDDVEDLVVKRLASTALFAARFRENAARALLLPRRRPGGRNPLWAQRKRAADLLAVAARYPAFPIILETYRECLRDVFDLPALVETLRKIEDRRIRIHAVESRIPSPFASSLLFTYVSNFIYEGDSPLAERRAQTLAVDQAQLRELLGEAELRDLLDPDVIDAVERMLQRLDESHRVKHADGLHDMLLAIGDLTGAEIRARSDPPRAAAGWLRDLERERRVFRFKRGGSVRFAAAEDAARYRDALGIAPPPGFPSAFLEPVADALDGLLARYARAHGPFPPGAPARRFGLGRSLIEDALARLEASGRMTSGAFLRGGRGREWCDPDVLRRLKRRSLDRLRADIEPVEPAVLARFLIEWQGIGDRRRGAAGALAVIDRLQGYPIVASALESEVLPARIEAYEPALLDSLCATGAVVWRGVDALGPWDGRIALYLREHYPRLAPPAETLEDEPAASIVRFLSARGASFFADMAREIGGFRRDLLDALWRLVWSGAVTNDGLTPLRSLQAYAATRMRRGRSRPSQAERLGPPGSEGRWSLLPPAGAADASTTETERRTALAGVLLDRYGLLAREAAGAEGIAGGFSAVYPVLKAMEEAGRIRRGYFVAGLGAAQFAAGGAEERLRALREPRRGSEPVILSAIDPANPYGTIIPWPARDEGRLERRAGAQVVLKDGELLAYKARNDRDLVTFLPGDPAAREEAARALARALAAVVEDGGHRVLLIAGIDGGDPSASPLAPFLEREGFLRGMAGYLKRAGEARDRWARGARIRRRRDSCSTRRPDPASE